MIRVLVADDSGFMRMALRRIIEADGDLRVVAEAPDGATAVEQAARLRPDIVSMDLEMPGLDGLAATRRLAVLPDPPAVIMVSHHTREGNAQALAALDAGAVDVLWKGSALGGLDLGGIDRELRGRLRHWAGQRRPAAATPAPLPPAAIIPPVTPPPRPAPPDTGACDLVVVGASTGGPDALALLLAGAGPLPVPTVVAQHMPADLADDFARHLSRRLGAPVLVGTAGMPLRAGEVVIIPGSTDGHLARAGEDFTLRLALGEGVVHPSVDLLFRSAAVVARRAAGAVLTGMGRDGAAGAAAMRERGMPVLAQSPESCVVAGMPGAVIEGGLATEIAAPAAIGARLRALTDRARHRGPRDRRARSRPSRGAAPGMGVGGGRLRRRGGRGGDAARSRQPPRPRGRGRHRLAPRAARGDRHGRPGLRPRRDGGAAARPRARRRRGWTRPAAGDSAAAEARGRRGRQRDDAPPRARRHRRRPRLRRRGRGGRRTGGPGRHRAGSP
ncbi:chemotaxis protein CheB [Roseomonas sp. CCTCC AB2023176]|uniref:chemotaxis protein CheB n=1 Tax=Roseomonas sp. CCTCC AB2023176 TaxID=3342640 RepID=UPI0035DDF5C6